MRRVAALLALPHRRKALLLRAWLANLQACAALHVLSLDRLRAWAGHPGSGRQDLRDIVWAGQTAARYTPFSTCLSGALALQRLLSRNGHASTLHIGVARDASDFVAHAWIERDGTVLIGEDERLAYTTLTRWPAGDRDAGRAKAG